MRHPLLHYLWLLFFCFSGCTQSDGKGQQGGVHTRSIVDMAGRTVQIPLQINRIVCDDVLAFQTLALLGATSKIVERRQTYAPWTYQVFPALKTVKQTTGIHIESYLQNPSDVVFTYHFPQQLQKLASLAIPAIVAQPVAACWPNNTAEAFIASQKRMVRLYAEVLGTDSATAQAERWCHYTDSILQAVTNRTQPIPSHQKKRVYILRGPDALTTHGSTGYLTWYGTLAGGDMITKNLSGEGGKVQISMEEVIVSDPEVIFISRQYSEDLVYKDPRWQQVTAVKNKRVYPRPEGVFYWDGGTEAILLVPFIARTLYPERFADWDMVQTLKDYYATFYHYPLKTPEAEKILAGASPDGSRENHYNN